MQTQRVKDDIRPLALKTYVWLYVYNGPYIFSRCELHFTYYYIY